MIRVQDNHAPRLDHAIDQARLDANLSKALSDGATTIAEDARHSILDGAISGSGHIPSAPGEPPNADTHDLDQSIHALEPEAIGNEVRGGVTATSGHALYMELGTSHVHERPFLRPATQRNRGVVLNDLRQALGRTLTR